MPLRLNIPLPHRRPLALVSAALSLVVMAACGGASAPAGAEPIGYLPSLLGQRVMVFPVQRNLGVPGDATAEMVFALEGPGQGPEWLLPDELRAIMARTPALDAPLENLPVDVFLRAEVRRIGDPIFGILRRMGAVTDADLALLPVAVRAGVGEEPVAVEYVVALVDTRTGRVLWFGAAAGRPGAVDDPGRLASAAEGLARRLVPPRRGGELQ